MALGFQGFFLFFVLAHCSPQHGGDKFCSINATLGLKLAAPSHESTSAVTQHQSLLTARLRHTHIKKWLSELQLAPEGRQSQYP